MKHPQVTLKVSLPLTSSISFVFLLLEMQKRLKQTKVYDTFFFLFCLKRNDPQTFKSDSCKNKTFLQCVLLVQLASMNFFILCDNCETLFFIKFTVTLRIF